MSCPQPGGLLEQPPGVVGLLVNMRPGSLEEGLIRIRAETACNPQVVTISINKRIITNAAAVATDHRVQILAKFGTGAGLGRVLFDARHGARITVPTATLYVSVLYLGTVGPIVEIGASAAYGSRPGLGEAPLTFTEAAETVAAAMTGTVTPVPAYATRVAWFSPDDPLVVPPAQATIQFSGEPTFAAIEQQLNPNPGVFRAIAAGMEFMRLRNDAQDADFQVVYELCL